VAVGRQPQQALTRNLSARGIEKALQGRRDLRLGGRFQVLPGRSRKVDEGVVEARPAEGLTGKTGRGTDAQAQAVAFGIGVRDGAAEGLRIERTFAEDHFANVVGRPIRPGQAVQPNSNLGGGQRQVTFGTVSCQVPHPISFLIALRGGGSAVTI